MADNSLMTMPNLMRAHLRGLTKERATITYRDLANALGLQPPNTIHQVTEVLEDLMREDHESGVPALTALVVSKVGNGLPAPGFFQLAHALGRYDGPESGSAAEAYHAAELEAAWNYWSGWAAARKRPERGGM